MASRVNKAKINKEELDTAIKQAKEAENSENYFNAAIWYREALEGALKVQNGQLIKLCKNKIVEMNKKSIASGKDFKELEVTHKFSDHQQKTIQKIIDTIFNLSDINTILKVIGGHPYFFPKVKEVEALASRNIPLTYQLATLTTVSNKGHTVRGSSDGSYSWFMKMYDLSQQLIMNMYLDKLFYLLINGDNLKSKLSAEGLISYFANSNVIEPGQLKVVTVGIQRYFDKDYISALHILVPQFEALFLNVAQRCGIDIVAIDQKQDVATRTKTLSEYHLESPEFQNIFGEDFCRQIKFILFEPLGYKLRHKVAHGEIQFEECNFRNANIIIYLYLVVLSRAGT